MAITFKRNDYYSFQNIHLMKQEFRCPEQFNAKTSHFNAS